MRKFECIHLHRRYIHAHMDARFDLRKVSSASHLVDGLYLPCVRALACYLCCIALHCIEGMEAVCGVYESDRDREMRE